MFRGNPDLQLNMSRRWDILRLEHHCLGSLNINIFISNLIFKALNTFCLALVLKLNLLI